MQTAKSLTRLGGCIGWSEFLLSAYSFYWFCHTMAHMFYIPGRVAQPVTCLATDASLTADPGVARPIPARSHTFVEIDYEKNSITTIVFLFLAPPPPSSVNVICSFCLFYYIFLEILFLSCFHTNCLSPDQTVPYEAVGS